MSESSLPADRIFSCEKCAGEIRIPYDLPPTTAPCPLCGQEITSPPPPPRPAPVPSGPPVDLTQVESPVERPRDPAGAPSQAASSAPSVASAPAVAAGATSAAVREAPAAAAAPAPEAAPARQTRPDAPAAPPPSDPVPGQDSEAEEESGFREVNPLLPFLAVIGLIVVLLVAAVILNRGRAGAGGSGASRSAMEKSRFLREGWRGSASQRLKAFLDASTPEQRAPHIVGGRDRLNDLRAFYQGGPAGEKDTPLSAFSHFDLADADKKRGIFMMRYERPSQFDMREFFRPVAPLEIQYRLEEPGLLLASFASLANFSMEPVRVMAFFKQSGEELLLDWDVFVQTKYRTLREFGAYPQPGEVKTFRVIVNEDVATAGAVGQEQVRYYRFADPANSADYVKVPVGVGSVEGRILESLNWIGMSGRGVPSQTATVKLTWTEGENPRLRLQEIVCWEFLGLGGEEGNAVPGEKYNPFPGSPDGQPAEKKPPGAGGAPAGEA